MDGVEGVSLADASGSTVSSFNNKPVGTGVIDDIKSSFLSGRLSNNDGSMVSQRIAHHLFNLVVNASSEFSLLLSLSRLFQVMLVGSRVGRVLLVGNDAVKGGEGLVNVVFEEFLLVWFAED